MNVLLVDDDYFVVAALEKKIDWRALSIEQVHTAYSVAQARDILQKHSIQILVCDIEMPQGSGLELLAWIREEQYSIQTIFLTNYADFNYAQKAIELQSFDYFLKPIEFDKLSLIISKAAYKAKEQQSYQEAIQDGQLWKKNQKKLQDHFWRRLIRRRRLRRTRRPSQVISRNKTCPTSCRICFFPCSSPSFRMTKVWARKTRICLTMRSSTCCPNCSWTLLFPSKRLWNIRITIGWPC